MVCAVTQKIVTSSGGMNIWYYTDILNNLVNHFYEQSLQFIARRIGDERG